MFSDNRSEPILRRLREFCEVHMFSTELRNQPILKYGARENQEYQATETMFNVAFLQTLRNGFLENNRKN